MNGIEIYKMLRNIKPESYAESRAAVEREDLEKEVTILRDAVVELGGICDLLGVNHIEDACRYVGLADENDRLRKAVHGIYDVFKAKALKFIVDSDLSIDDLKLFKNIFKTYLK